MGIDNGAILIYGWTFDYDEFVQKVEKVIGEKKYNELIVEFGIVEICQQELNDLEEFKISEASPYYGS
jgi:hypothetical protein